MKSESFFSTVLACALVLFGATTAMSTEKPQADSDVIAKTASADTQAIDQQTAKRQMSPEAARLIDEARRAWNQKMKTDPAVMAELVAKYQRLKDQANNPALVAK